MTVCHCLDLNLNFLENHTLVSLHVVINFYLSLCRYPFNCIYQDLCDLVYREKVRAPIPPKQEVLVPDREIEGLNQ